MSATKCTWDAKHGWLTVEHVRDCDDHACSGCKPCGKSHCGMRGRCANHVDVGSGIITCPGCVGKVRKDLALVVTLHGAALPEEVVAAGVESDAMNLIGPAALPEHVDFRRGWCEIVYDRDNRPGRPRAEQHPYLVLGRWDLALRETYGPPTDLSITVSRAASYLDGLLAGHFPHGDEFEEFARDLAACRSHLEAVIHDSRTPEVGRPCPRCAEVAENGKGPKLRKRYASGDDEKTKGGEHDTWHCPADPEHWWSERDYRDRVAADYVEHADELPARELAERVNVPLSTLRKWAARSWDSEAREWREPLIVSRRKSADGRKLYRVEDVTRLTQRGA